MFAYSLLGFAAAYAAATLAAPSPSAVSPTIQLDNGTFTGTSDGTTDSFLGIKFAEAPRFNHPVPVGPYTGAGDATVFGSPCPQQASNIPSSIPDQFCRAPGVSKLQTRADAPPASEDCLNLNVWVPAGTNSTSRLPVVVWIYGGGFQKGSATQDGGIIVKRSVELGEPVVYVSMNYRQVFALSSVSAFGFIAGQEVKAAGVGNIGLEDQRAALRWIQKYITAFGGDPDRVTMQGLKCGRLVCHTAYVDQWRFHRAFMQSGATLPVGDISHGQPEYDRLVQGTSCGNASDTLECLRAVSYDTLKDVVDQSPDIIFSIQSLHAAWLPRVDGRFLTDMPQKLVLDGIVAPIPYVSGNVNDEGTMFSFNSLFIRNDTAFRAYILSNYIPGAVESDVGDLFDTLYPDDPTQGSPFDTGTNFSSPVAPEYKRLAAIQGDLIFQAPRRFFVEHTYYRQPTWSFLSKRKPPVDFFGIPLYCLGAFHGSDLAPNVYAPGNMTDYLVHFVNYGDPNAPGAGSNLINWPRYDNETRQQLTFVDDDDAPLVIENDTYRVGGFSKLTELSLRFPF